MSTEAKKMKRPERRPAINSTGFSIHETTTASSDILADELAFINHYIASGHARGRAHSKAVILDGKPGYFFVTSVRIGWNERRECIMFSTLVDKDILLTDFD
ncbi:hypothetical protein GJ698_26040 [Pseudoduganella sp. FT26W]|uniref:Uncharacterized protein n=1 Tax=Duganella aquatilis TaxID=2666082 RepID=A0A844D388_9BURK|nr:hypothetical protein [Duganella aquatilis]MRW87537.1 hypothetical protein [Duganella aquatilis]